MKKNTMAETTQSLISIKLIESAPKLQEADVVWKGALGCCAFAYVLSILTTIAPIYKMVGIQTSLWISKAIVKTAGWLHLPTDLGLGTNHYISQQQTDYMEFLLLMLLAFAICGLCAYLLNRTRTRNDYTFVMWVIWLTTIVSGCLYLFTPAIFSGDIFSYASYGRLLSVHHVNPYVIPPSAFPKDPTYQLVHWKDIVSIYGPVWLMISAVVGVLADPHPMDYLVAFRLCAFAAHLLNIWLVTAILRTMGRSLRVIAMGTLLYAWNPLVLLESSLGGHNDVFMLTFLLLGLLLSARAERRGATGLRGTIPALVAFTLAALVKLTAIPIIVFLIVKLFWNSFEVRGQAPHLPYTNVVMRPYRASLTRQAQGAGLAPALAIMISAGIVLVGYAPFWLGYNMRQIVTGFTSQPTAQFQFNSILAAISVWKSAHGLPAYLALLKSRSAWDIITAIVIVLIFAAGAIWMRRAPTTRTVALATLGVLAAFLLLIPWFLSWYVTWLVGLAVVCLPVTLNSDDRLARSLVITALTFSASALLSYYYVSIAWYLPLYVTSYVLACLATFGIPLVATIASLALPIRDNFQRS
jgi:hypothetical protein